MFIHDLQFFVSVSTIFNFYRVSFEFISKEGHPPSRALQHSTYHYVEYTWLWRCINIPSFIKRILTVLHFKTQQFIAKTTPYNSWQYLLSFSVKSGDSAAGDVEHLRRISESVSFTREKAYSSQPEILLKGEKKN